MDLINVLRGMSGIASSLLTELEQSHKKRIGLDARANDYTRRPLLPPGFLVVSCGTGVTSSILPILKPALASALIAALCSWTRDSRSYSSNSPYSNMECRNSF